MASQTPPKPKSMSKDNFYAKAANDPELLKRRAADKAELDAKVQQMLKENPGTVPSKWDRQRCMQMDRFCLAVGKRCIMWDDESNGFYLMLNWDWLRNQAAEGTDEEMMAKEQGWWYNVRQIIRVPLLDNTLEGPELTAWIDKHTMRVHHGILDKLDKLRMDEETQELVLDDPYWQELKVLGVWTPVPTPVPPPLHPMSEGVYPEPRPAPKPAADSSGGVEAAA